MADIVLGIGASHGPLLSTAPEQWDLRAKADRENKSHWFRGKTYDFESLMKERAPGFASQIDIDTRRERSMKCRRAMETLGRKFNNVAPDAVVIVGNDQREFFNAGLTPAISPSVQRATVSMADKVGRQVNMTSHCSARARGVSAHIAPAFR